MVAVSDATPAVGDASPEISFHGPPEEQARLEHLAREMADAELRRVAALRGVPAGEKSAALAATGEQTELYNLDHSNYAVVVYSARYQTPASVKAATVATEEKSQAAASGPARGWLVTVVARQNAEGKLTRLYGAVSDPREMDLYPEIRPVGMVDAEGYGRHSLLLRQQRRETVGWMLGRVSGYQMETIFETSAQ